MLYKVKLSYLGSVGSSRTIKIFVDGDGATRLKITKDGERLNYIDGEIGFGSMKTDKDGNVYVNLG